MISSGWRGSLAAGYFCFRELTLMSIVARQCLHNPVVATGLCASLLDPALLAIVLDGAPVQWCSQAVSVHLRRCQ